MPPPQPVTIYPNRLRLIGLFLAAAAFTAVGIYFARIPVHRGFANLLIALTSYFLVAFFGASAIYLGYRLVTRRPALIISEAGIIDRTSSLCVGLIPWGEIEALVPYTRLGQRFLGIEPINPESLIRRQPWFRRWLLALNRRLGFTPINILQATLPIDVGELAEQLARDYGVRIKRAV